MIELKGLAKKYAGSKVYALEKTDLTLNSGKIIGFIGHNGAGKSTTLKMMTGILEPTEGDVIINGKSILKDPLEARKEFGYVGDNPDLFLKLTGAQYLNFIGNVYGVDQEIINKRTVELAQNYLMEDSMNELIHSYSHGMRQKIMVMGALLHDPNVFILDEPLTGLDPTAARLLKNSMAEHAKKGNTVLFSTHVLEVAEKLCDEIIIINKGRIVYIGTLEQLKLVYPELSLEDIFFKVCENNV